MKKVLALVTCAVVVAGSLTVATGSRKTAFLGADVVSAASEATTTTPPASSSSSSTSSSSSSSSTKTTTSSTSSTSGKIARMLAVGSAGDDVKILQTNLNNNGYKLVVDGFFGPLTSDAVKGFQKEKGLAIDGIAGPQTLGVLIPLTTPTSTITVGVSGDDVKYLQINLNKLGYKLSVDGIFGNSTLNAVKDFQKYNGLAADGYAGPLTFGKLNERTATPVATVPTTPVVTPPVVTPPVDAVTSASTNVTTNDVFEKSIGKEGKWIVAIKKDLTFNKSIVVEGNFNNTKTPPAPQRKIALYDQDANHVVTARFTLTAPSMRIYSPNASIEHGTFKGNLYVSAPNFKLIDAVVDGNIYYTTQAAKDTANIDAKSSVTGNIMLADVDAVTTPSITNNELAFKDAISAKGTWIIAMLRDMKFNSELVLDGSFNNKKTPPAPQRKIAVYTHNDPTSTKIITHRFTLEAPKLTIKSPAATLEHGIFKGDIYVETEDFKLVDQVVNGNIFFKTQAGLDNFNAALAKENVSKVNGTLSVKAQ